jgi:hypothetical protein
MLEYLTYSHEINKVIFTNIFTKKSGCILVYSVNSDIISDLFINISLIENQFKFQMQFSFYQCKIFKIN